jgi:hypothetical protein
LALEIGGLSLSSCGTAAGCCRARAIDATYDVACRPLSRSTTCHVGRAGQEKGGIGAVEKLFLLAAPHDAITLAASSNGTPWTSDGFRASFNKAMKRLEGEGKIGTGLTFHGLRHTVGTLLIEAGVELDIVRRWLGQKTLAMAIHYSEGANTAEQMSGAVLKFDPLGSKQGTSNV